MEARLDATSCFMGLRELMKQSKLNLVWIRIEGFLIRTVAKHAACTRISIYGPKPTPQNSESIVTCLRAYEYNRVH